MYPDQPTQRVSHETIYHTLYAMPRGELHCPLVGRRELIACLRWSRDKRRSKTRPPDGRGHIAEMQSIHLRPPEVANRLIPGHRGGGHHQGRDEPLFHRHAGRTHYINGGAGQDARWHGAINIGRVQ